MSKYRIIPVVTQPGENPVIDRWKIVNKENDEVVKETDSYVEALVERSKLEEDVKDQTSQGSLARNQGHEHKVTLDFKGNGISSTNDGHSHRVVEGRVMLADGHTHRLVKPGSK